MISFAPQYPQFPMFDDRETEGNARPVTQTLKTDPLTGRQTLTISGTPEDLSAANPFTPTVVEPGEPIQVAGPVTPGMMTAQPTGNNLRPAAVGANAEGRAGESEAERQARAQQAAQAAMPVQPAMPSMAQEPAPTAQMAPPGVPAGASAVTQTAQTFRQPLAEPAGWMTDVARLQSNPAGLAAYYGNEANDAQGRNLARSLLLQNFEDQQRQQQAQQKVDQAITSGNMLDIAREAQKSGDEGSYIKAYLYQRLGLTKLAQDEQEKLSPTTKWERVMTQDNKPALVKVDRRGMPIEGYSQEGRLTDQQLIGINAGRQLDIVGGTYVNDRTGQVGRVVTDKRTGQSYIQTDTGAVPMTGFRPQSSTGTMDMQRAQQIQRQNIELAGDWAKTGMRIAAAGPQGYNQVIGEFNAKYGTNFTLQQFNGPAPQISLETGMMTQGAQPVQMAPQPVAPQPGAAPAAVSPAMVQPTPAAPAAVSPALVQPAPAAPAQPAVVPQPSVPVRPQISAPVTQPTAPGAGAITPAQVQGAATIMPPVFTPSPIQPGETPGVYAERVRRESEAYASALRQSEARQQAGLDVGVARQRAGIEVGQARSQSFNKILDEEVRPQAQAGDTVSGVRKQQFAIFDRPGVDMNKIFGLYNAAGEGANAQKFTIVRDILGGMFKPEVEVSQRLAQLNLTPQEKSALMEYNAANQRINAATLKATAGPGSVSDAEQKINRESNVDITKVPALGAYNAMAQSQFDGDRARWKADWALTQPATNALELDREWRKESSRLTQIYADIARQRIAWIQQNGSTTDAVRQGYKKFPVPEYDAQSGRWIKTRPISQILGR